MEKTAQSDCSRDIGIYRQSLFLAQLILFLFLKASISLVRIVSSVKTEDNGDFRK